MTNIDRLVNILGGYGVQLFGPDSVRGTPLRSVAMNDPAGGETVFGDLFLAVGVASVARAVRLAARARSAVVVLRGDTEPDAAARARAERAGVAVVLVDTSLSWSQLAGIVYGVVQEARETEAGRGPSDLFALADTIAAAVGGPVTIEDQMSRVAAYSGEGYTPDPARLATILGRRAPEEVRELFERIGVFTHLSTSDEPLFVAPSAEHGLEGRMVAAVRVGRELLGSLWVTCDRPLSDQRAAVLANGARTVATHLLRARVSADLERQVESELVIQSIEGHGDPAAVIGRLGLPPNRFRVIAVQAHTPHERHAAILRVFEYATTGFGWSRPGRSTLFGNTVYTVLPCETDCTPVHAWLRDTLRGLGRDIIVTVGVGGPAAAAQLPASRREADESLALHASRPDASEPVVYDESWSAIVLHRLRAAVEAGRTPEQTPVSVLAAHDAAHATGYLATLRAWLDAQGDLSEAAESLGVHPNTVRYRMRKMAEVTDLRLDDPAARLTASVLLAAYPEPGSA
ncbi:PucR family transcriptional regulator [Nocardiopsis ansamitocini]|uniref:PucR family transcriptional regulator n=1 Tax=Nocardiopsis ansamitocini TaxID=1670832 RepID=UPI002557A08A|nr:PucR family transcriptional regulator [Nocardiopsis ansamitocini]